LPVDRRNSGIVCGDVPTKVKLTLSLIKHVAMKVSSGLEVKCHTFLTSALCGNEWAASCFGQFMCGKSPQHLLVRRLDEHCREFRTDCHPTHKQLTVLTELAKLQCKIVILHLQKK
jgi:hypothetical protein